VLLRATKSLSLDHPPRDHDECTVFTVLGSPAPKPLPFAYTFAGTAGTSNGSYRKPQFAATFTQAGTLVTVTSTAHGLVTSDVDRCRISRNY